MQVYEIKWRVTAVNWDIPEMCAACLLSAAISHLMPTLCLSKALIPVHTFPIIIPIYTFSTCSTNVNQNLVFLSPENTGTESIIMLEENSNHWNYLLFTSNFFWIQIHLGGVHPNFPQWFLEHPTTHLCFTITATKQQVGPMSSFSLCSLFMFIHNFPRVRFFPIRKECSCTNGSRLKRALSQPGICGLIIP